MYKHILDKRRKNKRIVYFYLFISGLFIINVFLSFNGYSFRGYYTDKIINWLWLVFTIFFIVRFWNKLVVKIYLIIWILVLGLSILPMMIPFFGILYFFTTIDDYQQINLSDKYRLERSVPNALSMVTIDIYEKRGIVEKKISSFKYSYIFDNPVENGKYENENPQIRQREDSMVSLLDRIDARKENIQKVMLIEETNDSLTILFQILNKEFIYKAKTNK